MLASVLAIFLVGCTALDSAAPRAQAWQAAWGSAQLVAVAAPVAPAASAPASAWQEPLQDVTLRQFLRLSLGGTALRVRVSNVHGRSPLVLGGASVALTKGGAPEALQSLRFGGQRTLTLAAGEERWSDPVALTVPRLADLAVQLHVLQAPREASTHPGSRSTSYARAGAHVDEADWTGATPRVGWWFLSDVDLRGDSAGDKPGGVLVAIGDSITDGYGVPPDSYQRWTDALARRLAQDPAQRLAVVNTGIGGNRLLLDGLGPSLRARFERDALARSGATQVLVQIGVNDLGVQHRNKADTPAARAQLLRSLQATFKDLAALAHGRGLCFFAATVTPYRTSGYYQPGPDNEADRQALNAWIRSAPDFDAVADFDAVLRDPAQPDRLRADLDSGDGLHPSMAGYRPMADALPPALLQPCQPRLASTATPTATPTTMPTAQSYTNPVLSGFHADPSICRVGPDYYLATSSFEYFPGVPIHHSRDLVHWRLIGHAITREGQLSLAGRKASKGIFAPTLRCHDGVFYVVTTDVEGGGNFFVHTRDPAGEWSDPVWLPEPVFGMDPSLFFDDDGRVYYTRHGGLERGGIYQAEIDLRAGRLLAEPKLVWSGTGGIWPEGPHLYKRQGWYYLLISEGGTSYGHSLTVARARSPWGPFESHPGNPILTHRDQLLLPLQALGHADLVQTPAGDWWMVLLGVRPQTVVDAQGAPRRHHHLGRETLLAPLHWGADGWPVVHGGQPLQTQMPAAGLPPSAPWPAEPVRETFAPGDTLPLHWSRLRGPATATWSLRQRPGWLRQIPGPAALQDVATPAFLGRRQLQLHQRFATLIDFTPGDDMGHAAGLVLRQNENHHVLLQRVGRTHAQLQCVQRQAGVNHLRATAAVPAGPLELEMRATPQTYRMAWRSSASAPGHTAWQPLCEVPTHALSSETAGGFTGVFMGLFATQGASPLTAPAADYAWVDFESAFESKGP